MFELGRNILILLCYICVFGVMLSLIIHYYSDFSANKYVWMCSKILTVKQIVENNNINRVFSDFNNKMEKLYYKANYSNFLNRSSKDECKKGYKKCGILDTYNNSFCISESSNCPINKMQFDSSSKSSEYLNNNFQFYNTIEKDMFLYCKRGVQESDVIVSWIYSDSQPKYIDNDNFILDSEAFEEVFNYFDKKEEDEDDDDDDDDNGYNNETMWEALSKSMAEAAVDTVEETSKILAKYARILKFIDYVENKFNEESNIDYNYINIGNNNYVKNYIGFESEEDINKFDRIDFSLYKERYPSYSFLICSYICGAFFFISIILFIIEVIYNIRGKSFWTEKLEKVAIISYILYCITFLAFFIYSLVVYATVYNKESFDLAKSIKADKFIEDFLKEFYEPFENPKILITTLVFLSISAIMFISAWVIEPCYNKCIKN